MGKTFIEMVQEVLDMTKSLSRARIALKQKTAEVPEKFTGSLIIDFHDNLYCRCSIKDENNKVHEVDAFHDNLKRIFHLKS